MDWNALARAMQRAPFFAQGTEEALERGLKLAAGLTPKRTFAAHRFVPHRKFPWFCDQCGYGEAEPD